MVRRLAPAAGLLVFVLAACSGGGSTASGAPDASEAPGASEPAAAGGCSSATETGTVNVQIVDFAFSPNQIQAGVGDVITWTNQDTTAHTATLDDGSCSTDNLDAAATGSLTFSAPGTYAYHCKIHPNMTGTVEIS